MSRKNRVHNQADLTTEQIEEYRRAGLWPPPSGIVILPKRTPSEKDVLSLMESLARLATPGQREIIDRAKRIRK